MNFISGLFKFIGFLLVLAVAVAIWALVAIDFREKENTRMEAEQNYSKAVALASDLTMENTKLRSEIEELKSNISQLRTESVNHQRRFHPQPIRVVRSIDDL